MKFKKTRYIILLALTLSAGSSFASLEEPSPVNVPEGGSTLPVLALAIAGIAVLRRKFRE